MKTLECFDKKLLTNTGAEQSIRDVLRESLSESVWKQQTLAALSDEDEVFAVALKSFSLAASPNEEKYKDLDEALWELRSWEYDRASVVFYPKTLDDTPFSQTDEQGAPLPFRVFKTKKDASLYVDVGTVFARGVDIFRGALALIYLKSQTDKFEFYGDLKKILQTFYSELCAIQADVQLTDYEQLTQAGEALALFNQALVSYCLDQGIAKKLDQVDRALSVMRDLCFKDRTLSFITPSNAQESGEEKRLAAMVLQEQPHFSTDDANVWQPTAPWIQTLRKKCGVPAEEQEGEKNWFDSLLESDFWKRSKFISPTPMSRHGPNPGNATHCTSYYFSPWEQGSGISPMRIQHTPTAITEPYEADVHSRKSLLTYHNQACLVLSDAAIQRAVKSYVQCWTDFETDKRSTNGKPNLLPDQTTIEIPYLHQTLIVDGLLSPDWFKTPTALRHKAEANQKLRAELAKKKVFLNIKTGKVVIDPKDQKDQKQGWRRVNLLLLETNHCINLMHPLSVTRNKTIESGHELLRLARERLHLKPDAVNQDDLTIVLNFLEGSDLSVISERTSRGPAVKAAVDRITTQKLLKENNHPDYKMHRHYALLLQAAVEYKCVVHENWMQRGVRAFNNSRLASLPVIGLFLRGALFAVELVFGLTLGLSDRISEWWGGKGRRSFYRAVYESILLRALGGYEVGGCMSAMDRAKARDGRVDTEIKRFMQKGNLVSFNETTGARQRKLKPFMDSQTAQDSAAMQAAPGRRLGGMRGWRGGATFLFDAEPEDSVIRQELLESIHLRKGLPLPSSTTTSDFWAEYSKGVLSDSDDALVPDPNPKREIGQSGHDGPGHSLLAKVVGESALTSPAVKPASGERASKDVRENSGKSVCSIL